MLPRNRKHFYAIIKTMKPQVKVQPQTALITGGSSGIGLAFAEALAEKATTSSLLAIKTLFIPSQKT